MLVLYNFCQILQVFVCYALCGTGVFFLFSAKSLDSTGIKATSYISAMQAGEGDPSPDNVRSIAGWDAVQLWHGAAYDEAQEAVFSAVLPETVWGGTLDWTTGILTITHFVQTFDGTEEWTQMDDGFFSYYNDSMYARTAASNAQAYHVCSHFKADRYWAYASASDNSCHERNNNKFMVKCTSITTLDDWTAYLAAQAAGGTPLTVVWEYLPKYHTTIQLTAQQLEALQGVNYVWSDCGNTRALFNYALCESYGSEVSDPVEEREKLLIVVSATEPTSPETGMLWFDIS